MLPHLSLRTISSKVPLLKLIGQIDGRPWANPAVIDHPLVGRSSRYPSVLKINVSDQPQACPLGVGPLVKRIFFKNYPDFRFTVNFSCGRPRLDGVGTYADPTSVWFNVFFGYYRVDVPVNTWKRPFGFFNDVSKKADFDDLIRIAKADWHYFSSYIYGVPSELITTHDTLWNPGSTYRQLNEVGVKDHTYQVCEVDNTEVVSAYVSGIDNQHLVENCPVAGPIWRAMFGKSSPHAQFPHSFFPVRMRMRSYVDWEYTRDSQTGELMYSTYMTGGAVNYLYRDAALSNYLMMLMINACKDTFLVNRKNSDHRLLFAQSS